MAEILTEEQARRLVSGNEKAAPALCPSGYQHCMLCGHGIPGRRTREVAGTLRWSGTENYGQCRILALSSGELLRIDCAFAEDAKGAGCTRFDAPAVGDFVRITLAASTDPGMAPQVARVEVCKPRAMTRDEALAEAKRIWGPGARAFDALDGAPLVVGMAARAYTGKTFEDALYKGKATALAEAFAAVGRAILCEGNKREGQRLIDACPKWAYPLGWKLAVMAAVEWANRSACVIDLCGMTRPFSEWLTSTVREYHDDRVRFCATAALKRRGDGAFAAAVCPAYERGRGAPGGAR